jgi:hypothetical protein
MFSSRKTGLCAALSAVAICFAVTTGAQAATVTENWNGDDSFNSSDSTTFSGFTSNQLTSVTGTGTYEASEDDHGHAVSTTFELLLKLNGTWTDVLTWTSTNTIEQLLSGLSTPINFASSTVTGIELTASPSDDWNDPTFDNFYHFSHDQDIGEAFTFNSVAATPLPATLPLFAGGLSMLGLFSRRKKQNAQRLSAA